jgi:predicted lipoprotein with Yx(FWY)xxD motif
MRGITTALRSNLRRSTLPVFAIGILSLASCGNGASSTETTTGGSSGTTVMVSDASGQRVLTTPAGATLYTSDQEKGKVLCTSSACGAIWTPLTVSAGDAPTGPGRLAKELSTIKRPDGTAQVALNGRPLYTFSFDHGAGQVSGDGESDSFDGTNFTWHAATPSGKTPAGPSSSTPTSPYSSSSGGYNY